MRGATNIILGLLPAGLAMIAVTYGLARFAYGLFLPELREAFELDAAVLGLIGSGSYVGYCVAITISLIYTSKVGPRFMVAAAGVTAVVGMALIAAAPSAPFLAAGDLVGRFGLGVVLRGALLAMAASIGMLAAAPGVLYVAYPSAALFGATYIMLTGILLVWAVKVFRERPSAGLGAAFLLISAGQILGSYFAGVLTGTSGLQTTFVIFAGVAILSMAFGPRREDS